MTMKLRKSDKKIFDLLIDRGVIPASGVFVISDEMIDAFYTTYREVNPPKGGKMKKTNIRYAKKLARLIFVATK